jgi:hypothetical protein
MTNFHNNKIIKSVSRKHGASAQVKKVLICKYAEKSRKKWPENFSEKKTF